MRDASFNLSMAYFFFSSRETCFLCHYAHISDLESTKHNSAEVQDWLQQDKLQLVRRYKGQSALDFANVAVAYTKSAAERMDLWRDIDDGKRVVGVQRTFEEMKKLEYHHPRPKPPPMLPLGGGKSSKCVEKASSMSKGDKIPRKQSRLSGHG